MGIFAPSTAHEILAVRQGHLVVSNWKGLPGRLGGVEPTIFPMSVETHPGQQEFISNPELSRARTAVKALMHALLTLYACFGHPFISSVLLSAVSYIDISVFTYSLLFA